MGTIIPAWGMIGLWTDKIGLDLTSPYSDRMMMYVYSVGFTMPGSSGRTALYMDS
jgi:hypothetical protein